MNGPVKMYRTHQIIRHDLKISLPECIYKMKNIHATSDETGPLGDHVSPSKKSVDISKQVKQFLKILQYEPEMTALVERQERILKQLDELRQQMISLKSDLSTKANTIQSQVLQQPFVSSHSTVHKLPNILAIGASPLYPPYSLLVIQKLWCKCVYLKVQTYVYSKVATLPERSVVFSKAVENFKSESPCQELVRVAIIWKGVEPKTTLTVSQFPIIGEVNILRYFARMNPHLLAYETLENVNEIDAVLDVCHLLVRAKTKTERQSLVQFLSRQLGKSQYLCGRSSFSIADLAAWSAIKQIELTEFNQAMTKWLQRCDEIFK